MRAVVVPSTLLMLPEYAGQADPIPDLRDVCRDAVSWLLHSASAPVVVVSPPRPDIVDRGVADPAGLRVARHLLSEAGHPDPALVPWAEASGGPVAGDALLVVANGSACRSEKAPGHLDPRARPFDAEVGRALAEGDARSLAAVDQRLAEQLWCFDGPALEALALSAEGEVRAETCFADDPFGVMYWVVRWSCAS